MPEPNAPDATRSPATAWEPSPAMTGLRDRSAAVDALARRGLEPDVHGEDPTGLGYFTGYSYHTLYDWDQYFETLVQLYLGWGPEPALNGVRIFLSRQRGDGFIARSVPSTPTHDFEHVKPFLCQIVVLVARGWGEASVGALLGEEGVVEKLKRYLEHWRVGCGAEAHGAPEEFRGMSVWDSAPHTGMDNQHERAGYWRDATSVGVDLNCYLVRELRALAAVCRLAGGDHAADADGFEADADRLAAAVRERLWDDDRGFFFDGNARATRDVWSRSSPRGSSTWYPNRDRLIGVPSVSGFAPLFAEVATAGQARRMIDEHLLDPRRFGSAHPVPALSRDHPFYSDRPLPGDVGCNWRANAWLPTNYMLVHGLSWYGHEAVAEALSRRTHGFMGGPGFREYFDSETGEGRGLDPFWGWTLLAHFLPAEGAAESALNRLAPVSG